MKTYVDNKKEYVKNLKEYVKNMKKYVKSMKEYEEICDRERGNVPSTKNSKKFFF